MVRGVNGLGHGTCPPPNASLFCAFFLRLGRSAGVLFAPVKRELTLHELPEVRVVSRWHVRVGIEQLVERIARVGAVGVSRRCTGGVYPRRWPVAVASGGRQRV